jgi:diacylglycerol kinase (ATP)
VRRAAILFNPISGAGRAADAARRAEATLSDTGWTVERVATTGPGAAESLARERAHSIELLVVAGGDGSIREAIAGLGESSRQVPIAIVPCGNANVVARELGVPLETEDALELLHSERTRSIDVGRANGELFLAMVGVGWDARTVHNLSRMRRSRLGQLWYRLWADSAYLAAGLAALFARTQRLRLTVDGRQSPLPYYAALLANFRCYGKGWTMAPDADCASGRIHFQALKRSGFVFIAWQLIAAMLHRRTAGFISDHGDGRAIAVEADRPFHLQIDGDDRGTVARLEVEVSPAAARVLAPARPARD